MTFHLKDIKVMDKSKQTWQFDSEAAKSISHVVHTIKLGDVEDPDLHIAAPIWDWQQSEAGKYVMQHSAPKAKWCRMFDPMTYGYQYQIVAYFTPKKLTYWKLKFE